jgi:hypothetical protein
MVCFDSVLAPKSPLQHRREECIQLGGDLRLVALEVVELGLQAVKVAMIRRCSMIDGLMQLESILKF